MSEIFFLPQHNVTQEKWTGPKLGPESADAAKVTGFDKVESLDKMHDELLKIPAAAQCDCLFRSWQQRPDRAFHRPCGMAASWQFVSQLRRLS